MKFLLSFVLLFSVTRFVKAQSVLQIRELYYRASLNAESADSLYTQLKNLSEKSSTILLGYKGVSAMLISKYSINPYTKLKYFNEGKMLLDKAINSSSDNTELRFLRYSVQKNVPSFLGYSSNTNEDKVLIKNKISTPDFQTADKDLYDRIVKYLSEEKS